MQDVAEFALRVIGFLMAAFLIAVVVGAVCNITLYAVIVYYMKQLFQ